MTVKLVYGAVRENPRKVIHVVRVLDGLLDDKRSTNSPNTCANAP